jgi:hypothetical protein
MKKNKQRDFNKIAASIVADKPLKNQAAVELGRLGGLKGGKARAEKLTASQRRKIAIKAAHARWKKE